MSEDSTSGVTVPQPASGMSTSTSATAISTTTVSRTEVVTKESLDALHCFGYEDVQLIASRQQVNIYRAVQSDNGTKVIVKGSTGGTVSSSNKYKITNEYELGSKVSHKKCVLLICTSSCIAWNGT